LTVQKPRLQFLESIRGIAAFVVLLYHCTFAFFPYMLNPMAPELVHVRFGFRVVARSPLAVFYNGNFAVVVFFVLSGFVLSYSFFRNPRHESLTAAALRRYFRLMVPVLLSVLISYLIMTRHWNHNIAAAALAHSDWLGWWSNFTPRLWTNDEFGAVRQGLYGAFFNMETRYNNVLWTMAIELPGSLLVYAFLSLFGTVRNRWLLYIVCGMALAWGLNRLYLFDFLMGVVLCDAYVRFELRDRLIDLKWLAWPLLAIGLVFGGYNGVPGLGRISATVLPTYFSTIGGVMVVGVPLFSPHMQRMMHSRPLAWLGRISFGLYLVHVLILLWLTCGTYVYLRQTRHWGHDAAALGAIAVEIAAALAGGTIMYFIADLPSIAIGRWLAGFVFMPRPPRITNAPADPELPPQSGPQPIPLPS
jgi:peptidoglycan/LPS O-acetylase OafA/YrhL